jgi:hypothetical protein
MYVKTKGRNRAHEEEATRAAQEPLIGMGAKVRVSARAKMIAGELRFAGHTRG